jgi:hypothetical protein
VFFHTALFRWKEGTTPQEVAAVRSALEAMVPDIPEIRHYRVGADAGLVEGNWDFVVVADFDDEAGWRAYTAHPVHQSIIAELIRPLVAERAAVQSAG